LAEPSPAKPFNVLFPCTGASARSHLAGGLSAVFKLPIASLNRISLNRLTDEIGRAQDTPERA
jgi:hypothetical protein